MVTLAEVHQKFGECGEAAAAARRGKRILEPSREANPIRSSSC